MLQKARTRDALVAVTRQLMRAGVTPTVEQAADVARVSRATAYRYFPSQRALLAATFPHHEGGSLLGDDPPADVRARVALFAEKMTQSILAIAAATGIESFVWLVDAGGVDKATAAAILKSSCSALLEHEPRG